MVGMGGLGMGIAGVRGTRHHVATVTMAGKFRV